jgi:hypothetical protein
VGGDGRGKVRFAGLFKGAFGKSAALVWFLGGELWWIVWWAWLVGCGFSGGLGYATDFGFIFMG